MQVNGDLLSHLRGATSTSRTPAPWELDAMSQALDVVTNDERFQATLQRYAHGNGTSRAIAQAALAAIAKAAGGQA